MERCETRLMSKKKMKAAQRLTTYDVQTILKCKLVGQLPVIFYDLFWGPMIRAFALLHKNTR